MTFEQAFTSLKENAKRVKREIIKPMYKKLLKNGWTLGQIDEMDIHFYLDLGKQEPVYIDQIRLL